MNKLFKTAFTLIELLVVIAIIGILSGLIIVTMNGVTSKANIAKSQVFSNSLRNALMLNLVAEYKLDNNANDNWGNRNGTLHGTIPVTTGCPQGTCLSFNGTSSDYINIPDDDAVFNFGSKMTAMVWVKGAPQSTAVLFGQTDSSPKRAWAILSDTTSPFNKLYIGLSDNGLTDSGHYLNYVSSIVVFDNSWHLVGFTWNSGTLKIYVDGILDTNPTKRQNDAITTIYNSNGNLNIGCWNFGVPANCFLGFMDESRLYNEVIPTSQIKEQYYAGANRLLINGSVSSEEYTRLLANK